MKRLVYVTGAPGAGKSSLAAPLAAELVDTTEPVDVPGVAARVLAALPG